MDRQPASNDLAPHRPPKSTVSYQYRDLAFIYLATRFCRILITYFIPTVLNFMGHGLRNFAASDFFIGELETLCEIHHNLLSFFLL